jgi:putative hemolysin
VSYACPIEQESHGAQLPGQQAMRNQADTPVKVPKLLKTYMAIGARIAAAPAWDREFGTIDFLTLLDLKMISPAARHRFLAPLTQ